MSRLISRITACVVALTISGGAVPFSAFADKTYMNINPDAAVFQTAEGELYSSSELPNRPVGAIASSHGIKIEKDISPDLYSATSPYVNSTNTALGFHKYSNNTVYEQLGKMEKGAKYQEAYKRIYSDLINVYVNNTEPVDTIYGYSVACLTDICDLELTADDIVIVNTAIICANPQFYWINQNYLYTYTDDSVGEYYTLFSNDFSSSQSRRDFNEVIDEKADEYKAEADKYTTDYDKVKAVYNKLINEINYAYVEGTTTPMNDYWVHTVIGSFGDNKLAVCDGYALTLSLVLNYLDIENMVVYGEAVTGAESGGHGWNMIKLDDGNYYWFDATWDDPGSTAPPYDDFFAVTDELFCYTHKAVDNNIYSDVYKLPLPQVSDTPFDVVGLYDDGEAGTVFTSDSITYEADITDNTCAIIGADKSGDVVIPSEVLGFTVTEIDEKAFANSYDLTSVTIPGSVNIIRDSAFEYCTSLTSITIDQGCEYIQENAFAGCFSLSEISLPSGLKALGNEAFLNCTSLEALTIPYTIKYIGSEAFVGAGLKQIDISGYNIHYSSENGIVYGAGGNAVVFYPNCYGNETFEIPSQVIEIGRSAFYGDNDLTSITIGNNIYKIGNNAFQDSSLESADIKNSVYFIGDHAFYNCLDLDTVKIADSVSHIGSKAVGYYYSFAASSDIVSPWVFVWCDPSSYTALYCEANGIAVLNYDGTHEHKYSSTIVKPTFASQGYTIYKCEICGDTYTDDYTSKLVVGKTTLSMKSNTSSSITLKWNSVSNATGYRIYQYVNNGWKRIKETSSTSLTVTGLKSGTNYKFTIRALNTYNGKVYLCPTYTSVTMTTLPAVPTMKMTSNSSSSIKLSWNKVTGANQYVVYQSVNGKWKRIKVTSSNTYTVSKLSSGKSYNFTVRAYKTFGGKNYYCSTYKPITATTLPVKPKVKISSVTTSSVKLSWNKVTGATGYVVYKQVNGKWQKIAIIKSTSYTIKNLKTATTYKFAVRSFRTVNKKNYYSTFTGSTDTITASTNPVKPTISRTSSTRNTATLSWKKVSGATGYIVYKQVNGKWVRQGTTKSTSYTFKKLSSKKTYKFAVKAYRTVSGKTYNGAYVSKNIKTK